MTPSKSLVVVVFFVDSAGAIIQTIELSESTFIRSSRYTNDTELKLMTIFVYLMKAARCVVQLYYFKKSWKWHDMTNITMLVNRLAVSRQSHAQSQSNANDVNIRYSYHNAIFTWYEIDSSTVSTSLKPFILYSLCNYLIKRRFLGISTHFYDSHRNHVDFSNNSRDKDIR